MWKHGCLLWGKSTVSVFENKILKQIFGPKKDDNGEWKSFLTRNSITWTVHLILSGLLNLGDGNGRLQERFQISDKNPCVKYYQKVLDAAERIILGWILQSRNRNELEPVSWGQGLVENSIDLPNFLKPRPQCLQCLPTLDFSKFDTIRMSCVQRWTASRFFAPRQSYFPMLASVGYWILRWIHSLAQHNYCKRTSGRVEQMLLFLKYWTQRDSGLSHKTRQVNHYNEVSYIK